MILYAKTTSERASKGQGGNEYIEVQITDKNQKEIYNLVLIPHPEGFLVIDNKKARIMKRQGGGYDIDSDQAIRSFEEIKAKGEKKKGECKNKDSHGNACYDCEAPTGFPCGYTPKA